MDLKRIKGKLEPIIGKYKYAILILVIGIVLMMIPSTIWGGSKTEPEQSAVSDTGANSDIKAELENILSCVTGAGKVKVMLKESSGAETIYQTDEDHTLSDNSTTTRTNVITISDDNRGEAGLIRQINPPQYMGAIVLCQGADEPSVKLAIVDAVSKITGLGADKIAVLKMN